MSNFFEQGLEFENKNDYENALRLYLQAAEQNHDMAECRIGNIYRFGRGIAKDYEKALYWYHRSAKKGNSLAQSNIGSMYRFGQGVPKDPLTALKWYNLSAEQNNDFAKQYTQNKDDDFVEYEDVTDSEEENKGNKNDTNLLN